MSAPGKVVMDPISFRSPGSFGIGIPDTFRYHLEKQAHDSNRQLEPTDERYNEIPPEYGAALPLDVASRGITGSFGYPSAIYKVIDRRSGLAYALRRVDGTRSSPKAISTAQARWRMIEHPNIISLHRTFVHGGATYFAHEYWPCAQSLLQHYFSPTSTDTSPVAETVLWTYVLQLVAALRVIHAGKLACRAIALSHVLITSCGARIRVGGIGVLDALENIACKNSSEGQMDDVTALGHMILQLATRSVSDSLLMQQSAAENAPPWALRLRYANSMYSQELCALFLELVTKPSPIFTLCNMLSGRAFDELDVLYMKNDTLDHHIASEVGAGRNLRMMLLLNSALMNCPARWRETGINYHLSLFNEYAFQQVDFRGYVVVDNAHIIACLNKLDVGDSEEILLTSRDNRTVLVTSFFELRCALENAYSQLC